MSEDQAEVSLTFKDHKGFDASWVVIRGTAEQARRAVIEVFGIPQEAAEGLPLNEVKAIATGINQGTSNVAAALGAVPIEASVDEGAPTSSPWGKGGGSTAPQGEPERSPNAGLIGKLENAESIDKLKTLWAENKSAFEDDAVKEAYSKRGQALKGA